MGPHKKYQQHFFPTPPWLPPEPAEISLQWIFDAPPGGPEGRKTPKTWGTLVTTPKGHNGVYYSSKLILATSAVVTSFVPSSLKGMTAIS